MERTRKLQIVYVGFTNLCQHSTTDLARGIMVRVRLQSTNLRERVHIFLAYDGIVPKSTRLLPFD